MPTSIRTTNGLDVYGGLMSMPGYQVYEYQLVLAMPEVLKDKIRKVKQQFYEQFRYASARSGAILIPLVKFKQRQLLEDRVRTSLNQLVTGWRPFPVTLKDYGFQPTHSLYIPLVGRAESGSKMVLQQCIRDLRTIQHLMRPDKEHAAFFPLEHQVVIASRLPPGIYEKAAQQYSRRQFTGQFLVEACLLLRRKPGDPHWQIAQRFELRNLPVGAKQACLFEA